MILPIGRALACLAFRLQDFAIFLLCSTFHVPPPTFRIPGTAFLKIAPMTKPSHLLFDVGQSVLDRTGPGSGQFSSFLVEHDHARSLVQHTSPLAPTLQSYNSVYSELWRVKRSTRCCQKLTPPQRFKQVLTNSCCWPPRSNLCLPE